MKNFLISGLIDDYRIKTNIFAISPNHAIKVFQQKYSNAVDIYVIQNLFWLIIQESNFKFVQSQEDLL